MSWMEVSLYFFAGSVIQLLCEVYRLPPDGYVKTPMPIPVLILQLALWPLYYPFALNKKGRQ